MKIFFKTLMLAAIAAPLFTGCVGEDDIDLPPYEPALLNEKFEEGNDNTDLVTEGWLTYIQAGDAIWKIQRYRDNGYAEFNPYGSGDASNVGWLVSPAVNLAAGNDKTFSFRSAQAYVTNANNKLEVFISTNFDGTNVTAATWEPLAVTVPNNTNEFFEFIPSGQIDLSGYAGQIHVAFKVTGSGTNTQLDGLYQIDNVVID